MKRFCLELLAGLLIVAAFVGVGMLVVPEEGHTPVESVKRNNECDKFQLKATDDNTFIVTILVKNPREYVAALTGAIDKVEQKTGRKVSQIVTCGIPSTIYFYLMESPKSEEKDKE